MLILLRFALISFRSGKFGFICFFNDIRKPHEVTAKSFKFQFVYFGYTILGVVKACFTTILGVVACQNAVHYYHFGITSENLSPVYYYHFGIDILYIAMYVGKIKRSLPLQNRLIKRPKSRSPLRTASAYEETEASQPEEFI